MMKILDAVRLKKLSHNSDVFLQRNHDDVIKWKHFPRYWPFVRGIHRSPVNSTHKGQWRGALMFLFFYLRLNKRLSKQSRGWWFETPSRLLWLQCNILWELSFGLLPSIFQRETWVIFPTTFVGTQHHRPFIRGIHRPPVCGFPSQRASDVEICGMIA